MPKTLSKSEYDTLKYIHILSYVNINSLITHLNKTRTPIERQINSLKNKGYLTSKKEGRKHYYIPNYSILSSAFTELINDKPGDTYKEIICGKKPLVLLAILKEEKNVKDISKLTKINEKTVYAFIHNFVKRGIVENHNNKYVVTHHAWHKLYNYLNEYKHHTNDNKKALWTSLNKTEYLYETLSDDSKTATLTGFSAYGDYGVEVGTIRDYYFKSNRKLNKEEVFMHSLLQEIDARLLALIITFYIKNNLSFNKLKRLSLIYDCDEKLEDVKNILKTKSGFVKTKHFGEITINEIIETLRLYGVEWKNVFKKTII